MEVILKVESRKHEHLYAFSKNQGLEKKRSKRNTVRETLEFPD